MLYVAAVWTGCFCLRDMCLYELSCCCSVAECQSGWPVVVLDVGKEKEVSGSEVRQKLIAGQGWEALVPGAVAEVLRAIKAEERLRHV